MRMYFMRMYFMRMYFMFYISIFITDQYLITCCFNQASITTIYFFAERTPFDIPHPWGPLQIEAPRSLLIKALINLLLYNKYLQYPFLDFD
jgi:hypothetical protein